MAMKPLLLLLLCVLAVNAADDDGFLEFEDIEFADIPKEVSRKVTLKEYCAACPDPKKPHSLCAYKGVAERCGIGPSGVSKEDQELIVDFHNELRNKVASGKEKRGYKNVPQPPARDMVKLVWDNQLAAAAQHWADQCIMEHDLCRNDPRFNYTLDSFVTQNLAQKIKNRCLLPEWKHFIGRWYDEVDYIEAGVIDSFRKSTNGEQIGHYTALVNGQSGFIGCGYRVWIEKGLCNMIYACHYGPGGNYNDWQVYHRGKPRSFCPNTTLDKKYPSLCGSLYYDEYGQYNEFDD